MAHAQAHTHTHTHTLTQHTHSYPCICRCIYQTECHRLALSHTHTQKHRSPQQNFVLLPKIQNQVAWLCPAQACDFEQGIYTCWASVSLSVEWGQHPLLPKRTVNVWVPAAGEPSEQGLAPGRGVTVSAVSPACSPGQEEGPGWTQPRPGAGPRPPHGSFPAKPLRDKACGAWDQEHLLSQGPHSHLPGVETEALGGCHREVRWKPSLAPHVRGSTKEQSQEVEVRAAGTPSLPGPHCRPEAQHRPLPQFMQPLNPLDSPSSPRQGLGLQLCGGLRSLILRGSGVLGAAPSRAAPPRAEAEQSLRWEGGFGS